MDKEHLEKEAEIRERIRAMNLGPDDILKELSKEPIPGLAKDTMKNPEDEAAPVFTKLFEDRRDIFRRIEDYDKPGKPREL